MLADAEELVVTAMLILAVYEAVGVTVVYTRKGCRNISSVGFAHTAAASFLPIYLLIVLFGFLEGDSSNKNCNVFWKLACTFYIFTTLCVYCYYFSKQRVVSRVSMEQLWWHSYLEKGCAVGIVAMAVFGGLIFYVPGISYDAELKNGTCWPKTDEISWLPNFWAAADTMLSVALLTLFIGPLLASDANEYKAQLKPIVKRNILFVTLAQVCTAAILIAISISNPSLKALHLLCSVDKFFCLQCVLVTPETWKDFFFFCTQEGRLGRLESLRTSPQDMTTLTGRFSTKVPARTTPKKSGSLTAVEMLGDAP